MGGIHNTCGNAGGVGGYFCVLKMEILGRRGVGTSREIPSVVGVWIFSGTTQSKISQNKQYLGIEP